MSVPLCSGFSNEVVKGIVDDAYVRCGLSLFGGMGNTHVLFAKVALYLVANPEGGDFIFGGFYDFVKRSFFKLDLHSGSKPKGADKSPPGPFGLVPEYKPSITICLTFSQHPPVP
jgi:hypothetical protein